MHTIYRLEEVLALAKPKRVISFDLFDTLIYRAGLDYQEILEASSSFVSSLVEAHLGIKIPSQHILKLRRSSTSQLKIENNCHGQEPELKAVFERLLTRCGFNEKSSTKLSSELVKFELSLELSSLKLNEGVFELLTHLRTTKQTVIIVTDMYFSESDIRSILKQLDIAPFIDNLFVSSSFGVTKREELLFSIVLKELSIAPQHVIHVGDNFNSDVKSALRQDIDAVFLQTALDKHRKPSTMQNLVDDQVHNLVADLVLAFVFQIAQQSKVSNIDRLYFLSRDATAIGTAFEKVVGSNASVAELCKNVEARYLSVSRTTISFLNFDTPAPKLSDLLRHYLEYKGASFDFTELTNVLGLNSISFATCDYRIGNLEKCEEVEKRIEFENSQISSLLIDAALDQKRRATSYLTQERVVDDQGVIGLVDIGYAGTIGKEIHKFRSRKNYLRNLGQTRIYNILLCSGNADQCLPQGFPIGLVYSDSLLSKKRLSVLQRLNYSWFEIFFQSPDLGSLIGYQLVDSRWTPEFGESISNNQNTLKWLTAIENKAAYTSKLNMFHIEEIADKSARQFIEFMQNPNLSVVREMAGVSFSVGRNRGQETSIVLRDLKFDSVFTPSKLRNLIAEDIWIEGSLVASRMSWIRGLVSLLIWGYYLLSEVKRKFVYPHRKPLEDKR